MRPQCTLPGRVRRARLPGSIPIGLLFLAVLASCGDDPTTAGPEPVLPPDSFRITLPDTIVDGSPFTLTVEAVAQNGTAPDPAFDGPVALVPSSGSVSPATVTMTAGTATVEMTASGVAGDVTLTARSGAVEGSGATFAYSAAPPARLVIEPGGLLLTEQGQARPLAARAYDADGRLTVAEVTWTSTSPDLPVAADGTVTAMAPLASALVVAAEAGGVVSEPVVALAAATAEGVVLVADAQVEGDPVEVDPAGELGPGWRYQVRLRDIEAPTPGTLLLSSGGEVVAGRVASVASSGAALDVVLELVPLDELFEAFALDLEFPLDPVAVDDSEAVGVAPLGGLGGAPAATADIEFPVGFGVKCKVAGGVVPELHLQNASFNIDGDFDGTLRYDLLLGLELLAVRGEVSGSLTARPTLGLAWDGKVKCERNVKEFTVPFGGWLALLFGFQVPVGAGFEFEAELDVGEVGFEISAQASAEVELEYSCPVGGGCSFANRMDRSASGELEPVLPNLGPARARLDGFGYAYAKLNLGPSDIVVARAPFLGTLKFKLAEARGGLLQTLDLAGAETQASDPAYASEFALWGKGEVKVDVEMKQGLEWLGRNLGLVFQVFDEVPLWADSVRISKSPSGTFTIDPAQVAPGNGQALGDLATFRVDLDPVTYLGIESVEAVEIRWLKDDGNGGQTLENGRPSCHTMSAAPGQTSFACQTDFLEEHEGEQTFFAFVHAKLFGQTLPVPLEIDVEARAVVEVGVPIVVRVDPSVVTLEAGDGQQFTAAVTGADDPAVTWSATGGFITPQGFYVAGSSPGTFTVRATSQEDPAVWDDATVNIVLPLIEGEFLGTYIDVSTCITPGTGTRPVRIWLYEHQPSTNRIRVALDDDGGTNRSRAEYHYEGTIVGGSIVAFDPDDPQDYEFRGMLSGNSLTGRWYDHCGDGTADIWEFTATRVN